MGYFQSPDNFPIFRQCSNLPTIFHQTFQPPSTPEKYGSDISPCYSPLCSRRCDFFSRNACLQNLSELNTHGLPAAACETIPSGLTEYWEFLPGCTTRVFLTTEHRLFSNILARNKSTYPSDDSSTNSFFLFQIRHIITFDATHIVLEKIKVPLYMHSSLPFLSSSNGMPFFRRQFSQLNETMLN